MAVGDYMRFNTVCCPIFSIGTHVCRLLYFSCFHSRAAQWQAVLSLCMCLAKVWRGEDRSRWDPSSRPLWCLNDGVFLFTFLLLVCLFLHDRFVALCAEPVKAKQTCRRCHVSWCICEYVQQQTLSRIHVYDRIIKHACMGMLHVSQIEAVLARLSVCACVAMCLYVCFCVCDTRITPAL